MPLVLAHRGANKVAPQNTIPAFKKAMEFNADGLETDVHLSSDGHIVICHNYTVDETSNGTGRVDEMTLAQLKSFDFGSYFNEDFKGVSLPTLSELLDLTKSMSLINIEIKPPKKDCDLVKRVVETIHEYGIVDNSIVSCFDPECIRLVKEIDSNVKTGLLYEDDELGREIMTFGVAKYCEQLKANAAHPHRKLITQKEVMELHNLGMAVNPWTVNLEEEIIRFAKWGCDAIISDVPDYCRKVLENLK
ncbi:MAG: glycerophosphodiester phosphodiesterase [Clostridia bacterium]|nr:glycerophosphodiester phosphodiesterase [Clostridia bacterium]